MTTDAPASAALDPAPSRPGRPWRRLVVEHLAVLLAYVVLGVAGGWLWFQLWDPPKGAVQDGKWLYLDFPTIAHVFSGTGLYVVVGVVAGVVLGVVTALVCRTSELVTLVVVVAGSALASYLAYRVGLSRSAPDPHLLALSLPDGTRLPGRLEVTGRTPFVAWPLGSLLGLGVTYLFTAGVSASVAEARRVELGGVGSAPTDPDRAA
ncbi:hypothetical protein [Nocardioides rubriscoriae]|uniref:hypothetical protein n=1 Tax=Nocardioides rubriscoriae TaxID=642762 RepID=UPI0011DF3E03|nr:hypothetical protein [Nocardioides rubriscoriae]